MQIRNLDKRINAITSKRAFLLDEVRKEIESDCGLLTSLINNYLDNNTLSEKDRKYLEKVVKLLESISRDIISITDIEKVKKLRKRFNYYINRTKKIITNGNEIWSNNFNDSTTSFRKVIAKYIRLLKRGRNIEEIVKLSNIKDINVENTKKLEKLLNNERDYVNRNIKKVSKLEVEEKIQEIAESKEKNFVKKDELKKTNAFLGKKAVSLVLVGSLAIGSYFFNLFNHRKNNVINKFEDTNIELNNENVAVDDGIEYLGDYDESNSILKLQDQMSDIHKLDYAIEATAIYNSKPKELTLSDIRKLPEEDQIKYICESEGISEFQFYEIVSCVAVEGGDWAYDECYEVISSMRNRTLSKVWVSDCERYSGLDGTSIYNQMIWREPYIQYSGYRPGKSGHDIENLRGSEAYYAVIDFFLSGEKYYEIRTNNFKMFNTHGYAPVAYSVQLHPETKGNDYYGALKEEELIIENYPLEISKLVRERG